MVDGLLVVADLIVGRVLRRYGCCHEPHRPCRHGKHHKQSPQRATSVVIPSSYFTLPPRDPVLRTQFRPTE
eukprot:1851615-Prymnesium_polylepis.1